MEKRLFRGARRLVIYEDVEVFAETESEAIEMIEDDDSYVYVNEEREGDWEIDHIFEVKE
jgi:hypothetical protein